MKKLTINGKEFNTENTTIKALLMELNIPLEGAAVALNSEIVPRGEHPNKTLNNGDVVDIIRPIGGG